MSRIANLFSLFRSYLFPVLYQYSFDRRSYYPGYNYRQESLRQFHSYWKIHYNNYHFFIFYYWMLASSVYFDTRREAISLDGLIVLGYSILFHLMINYIRKVILIQRMNVKRQILKLNSTARYSFKYKGLSSNYYDSFIFLKDRDNFDRNSLEDLVSLFPKLKHELKGLLFKDDVDVQLNDLAGRIQLKWSTEVKTDYSGVEKGFLYKRMLSNYCYVFFNIGIEYNGKLNLDYFILFEPELFDLNLTTY